MNGKKAKRVRRWAKFAADYFNVHPQDFPLFLRRIKADPNLQAEAKALYDGSQKEEAET